MSRGAVPSVLYVTYDGLLEALGSSQVLPYVRALRARGFSIGVLSYEKPDDLGNAGRVARLEGELAGLSVPWMRLRYHRRPPLPATLWDVVAGWRRVRSWARGLPEGTPALIHARGYVAGLVGLAAKSAGASLLFDMRGFWVDERIAGGYWHPGGVSARVGRWMERILLDRSDELVLLAKRGRARLAELAPGGRVPTWSVVPTCVDLARFTPPDEVARARAEVGLHRPPVVIHTGTLTGWYDGRLTMAAGKAFVERTGGSFVVLTRDVEAARRHAAEVGVDPIIRTVEFQEVPRWLQASDAGLALPRTSASKDASFPTKVGEYLACGLAVLATPVGDVADLADDAVLGLLDEARLDEGVSWLLRAATAPDRARRARVLAEERLSVERGADALEAAYRRLGVFPDATARGVSP